MLTPNPLHFFATLNPESGLRTAELYQRYARMLVEYAVMTGATDGRLDQFENRKYLNLESYKKTGQAVATPMWFADSGGVLYVYSLAGAGKVKRIRNNPRVRVAPCDMRGKALGDWVPGHARILKGREAERGHRLLDQKYGWMKKVGNLFSRLMNRERVVIEIDFKDSGEEHLQEGAR